MHVYLLACERSDDRRDRLARGRVRIEVRVSVRVMVTRLEDLGDRPARVRVLWLVRGDRL